MNESPALQGLLPLVTKSPYVVSSNIFSSCLSAHTRKFGFFLLHLKSLLLNQKNSLKPNTDTSPRPLNKVLCLKLLLNPASLQKNLSSPQGQGGENKITCPARTAISTGFTLSYMTHTIIIVKILSIIFHIWLSHYSPPFLNSHHFYFLHYHLALCKGLFCQFSFTSSKPHKQLWFDDSSVN